MLTESKCSLLMKRGSLSLLCASRTQIVLKMAKTAKKSGKVKKAAQVEAGRVEESGGTDTERREDAPAERTVILTEAGMQEAEGSGWQQQGRSPASKEGSQDTDSSVERARLRLTKTGSYRGS